MAPDDATTAAEVPAPLRALPGPARVLSAGHAAVQRVVLAVAVALLLAAVVLVLLAVTAGPTVLAGPAVGLLLLAILPVSFTLSGSFDRVLLGPDWIAGTTWRGLQVVRFGEARYVRYRAGSGRSAAVLMLRARRSVVHVNPMNLDEEATRVLRTGLGTSPHLRANKRARRRLGI